MKTKKNSKKKKQRKMLLAILMLVITAFVFSISSYAWFTANKTVTVSTINVNVAASNGLQISVDGLEWKSVITNDDIKRIIDPTTTTYPTAVNQLPDESTNLAPVSTIGTVDNNGFMEMYLGEIVSDDDGNYQLTATKSTETSSTTSGHFVAFDLFFQVQEDTDIYLTEKSSISAGQTDSGIQNAGRVAFVVEGNIASGSSGTAIQSLVDSTATPIIWEPNYDVHTDSAVSHALSTYGLTTTKAGAAQLSYVGVKAPITTPVALNSTDANYFGAVTPTISTPASGISANAYQSAFSLKSGITKVRVYMWVEGQDVDCENMASGGQINFDVQFSSNRNSSGT